MVTTILRLVELTRKQESINMAKKMSSVDAALDIARKVRVQKKPVKK